MRCSLNVIGFITIIFLDLKGLWFVWMSIIVILHLRCRCELSLRLIHFMFIILQALPSIKVIIFGDLVNSEPIRAILCVLEAPRLLHDWCWSGLLYFIFFLLLFLHDVRLVVLSDSEQFLVHATVVPVPVPIPASPRRRFWIFKRAS